MFCLPPADVEVKKGGFGKCRFEKLKDEGGGEGVNVHIFIKKK